MLNKITMPKAILIDVGGPLVDEDEFYQVSDRLAVELFRKRGHRVAEEDYQKALREALRRCLPNPRVTALWQLVKSDLERFFELRRVFRSAQQEWFAEWEGRRLRPGAEEAVVQLAERYQLALAGNQPAKVKRFLADQGILDHFTFCFVSEELGVSKPDPLFFQVILDSLGMGPEEAVMVGDRLDADVYPAKLLGLKTIRVLVGPYAMQEPQTPFHEPDITIDTLAELPSAIARLTSVERGSSS